MKRIATAIFLIVAMVFCLGTCAVSSDIAGVFGLGTNPFSQAITGTGTGDVAAMSCDLDSADLDLSQEQQDNAAVIVEVAESKKLPTKAAVIGIATAMQESTLHNYGHLGESNDHDSLGLFQQRPSTGWGTPEELTDPTYASKKFFEALADVDGWEDMPLTQAAQNVQKSAFPDAYGKHEKTATAIVEAMDCQSGWIAPVTHGEVSAFRSAQRPDHHGTDLGSPRGTNIKAAAKGVVSRSECNATLHGRGYGCHRDGTPQVSGCGWHVMIEHPDNISTVYCHMDEPSAVSVGDEVAAGEIIGIVGSTGSSSGPHLHLEVHTNHEWDPASAVDPIPFFAERGITW